jgi:hypothetical protein
VSAPVRQFALRLPPAPVSPYERMMRRVVIVGECWLFNGARDQNGHGNVMVFRYRPDGTRYKTCDKAHRIAHVHHFGPIPAGHVVRHSCDVANCVRDEHVRETGPQLLNVLDMIMRGRAANQYGPWHTSLADITGDIDPDCPF